MNKQLVIILLAGVTIGVLSSSVVNATPEAEAETKLVVEAAPGESVTPYELQDVLYNAVGIKRKCWVCSSPCSHGKCCEGAFPQCCWVNGLGCRCCPRRQ